MKSVTVTQELHDYIERLYSPQTGILKELLEETQKLEIPMIQISSDQGRFLYMLTKLSGAVNALEIGTLTGYSGMHIAKGLKKGGMLVTVDINPAHSAVAQKYFEKAGLASKTQIVTSPALDYMKSASSEGRKFDLIFIDADKTSYRNYYEEALKVSNSGTLIIFDNMLKGGNVIDDSIHDPDLDAVREMNQLLSDDSRIEAVLLTVGDGFTLCRVI